MLLRISRRWLIAAALLLISGSAAAVVYRVGTDGACDFAKIGDALDTLATGNHSYQVLVNGGSYAENIVVDGKIFTLDGGYTSCSASTHGATATTITRDHTGDSILEIRGNSSVILSNLTISNGSITSTNGAGGGINFDGYGDVGLQDVTVSNNYAGYGGGINVDANGGVASLYLHAGTVVTRNTAQYSGGGCSSMHLSC